MSPFFPRVYYGLVIFPCSYTPSMHPTQPAVHPWTERKNKFNRILKTPTCFLPSLGTRSGYRPTRPVSSFCSFAPQYMFSVINGDCPFISSSIKIPGIQSSRRQDKVTTLLTRRTRNNSANDSTLWTLY